MGLFVETVKFVLGPGASAEIQPLTYRQRESARKAARDAALAVASQIDPKLLGTFQENSEAAQAAADVQTLTGDLDTVTVVESGLVSITVTRGDGESETFSAQDTDLLDKLTTVTFEKIAAEIYRISTLEDAENFSNA